MRLLDAHYHTSRSTLSQLDSSLVIKPGRLYLGRAREIRVTVAPGPLGRALPLRPSSLSQSQPPRADRKGKAEHGRGREAEVAHGRRRHEPMTAATRRADDCLRAASR